MPPDSVWIAIPHFAANFSIFGYQLGSFEFFSICLSNAFFFDFSRRRLGGRLGGLRRLFSDDLSVMRLDVMKRGLDYLEERDEGPGGRHAADDAHGKPQAILARILPHAPVRLLQGVVPVEELPLVFDLACCHA